MALFTFTTTPPQCTCDVSAFALSKPAVTLFDTTAKLLAEEISKPEMLIQREEWNKREGRKMKVWKVVSGKDANKRTQVRKFYDEVIMWSEKTRTMADLEKNLPFIKMMNAKVAYARGRDYVDDKFMAWFSSCLAQVEAADEVGLSIFQNFRILFEAFIGFYRLARQK